MFMGEGLFIMYLPRHGIHVFAIRSETFKTLKLKHPKTEKVEGYSSKNKDRYHYGYKIIRINTFPYQS